MHIIDELVAAQQLADRRHAAHRIARPPIPFGAAHAPPGWVARPGRALRGRAGYALIRAGRWLEGPVTAAGAAATPGARPGPAPPVAHPRAG